MIPTLFRCDIKTSNTLVKDYMERNEFENLRLIFDIKGLYFTIHSDEASKMELISDYDRGYWSYAEATIKLINHWIGWCQSHNIVPEIYLFAEHGDTLYHDRIDPGYKRDRKKRAKTSLPTEYLRDKFSRVLHENIKYLQTVLNTRGSGIKLIYLEDLEADFVASQIVNMHQVANPRDMYETLTVTFSKDKDLTQAISKNHIQLTKNPKQDYKIYTTENIFTSIIKNKKLDPHGLPTNMFTLALGIIGDSSDSVDGIKGIGEVAVFNILKEFEKEFEAVVDYESFMRIITDIIELNEGDPKIIKHLIKIYSEKAVLERAFKMIDFRPLVESEIEQINRDITLLPTERVHDPEYQDKYNWYAGQLQLICKTKGLEEYRHILQLLS